MKLPSKIVEQLGFNKKPKTEEHVLFALEKSTYEKQIYQPLENNNKQVKISVTFLTSFDSISNVIDRNSSF